MRKVVVTGIGIISPLGNNVENFLKNLLSGVSGVRSISYDFSSQLSVRIVAPSDFDPTDYFPKKQIWTFDRTTQMALAAASQAWNDSGLTLGDEEKKRAGVYIGTGLGGAQTLDETTFAIYRKNAPRVSPLSIVKIMSNAPASHIAIRYGLAGPCLTFSVACAASAVAIGEAYHRVRSGNVDMILAGGTESMMTLVSLKSWESLGVLAQEDTVNPAASCKPFSKDRTGFVLGEGAAVVVLEEMERARRRGAKVYAEIVGYGSACDAHHITGPSVEGQALAMGLALEDGTLGPNDVDYINAHGTATAANDKIETQAIKKVFAERAYAIPVSSTKSMHGHLLGAGAAVEFVASLLSIRHKFVPPTAHLTVPDPECDLDYVPNTARTGLDIKTVMSNSFAFGGTNAVILAREV